MFPSPQIAGFALAAIVAVAFASNVTAARLAFDAGTTPLTMNVARIVVSAVILFALLKVTGVCMALPRRTRLIALGLGVVMFFYQFAILSAVAIIPLALAILIFYTFPIMTSIYSWVSGREPVTAFGVAAVVVAFVGLVLALDIQGGSLHPAGVILAFLAALGLTIMLQFNHRLVGAGDSRPVTLTMAVSATVTGAVMLALTGEIALPQSPTGWIAFNATTLLYSFAIIGMYIALTMIGPMRMAMTMNLEPVISMLFGVFLLGQVLSPLQVFGGALVISGVLMVRLANPVRPQGDAPHD